MQRMCEKLIASMDVKIRRGEKRAQEEGSLPEAAPNVDPAMRAAQVR